MSETSGMTILNGVKEYNYFANGEWRAAEGKKLFDEYRPYDRSVFARVASSDRPEASPAVDAATKAFPAWSQLILAARTRLFFKAGGEPQ